jgi:AcrR family transcriptional regulator
MQLLDYVVREDWRERTKQMRRETIRLWRALQALVILSALSSLVVSFFCPSQPWKDVCHTALSSCLFIGFSVWTALRSEKPETRNVAYAGLATLTLVGTAAVGGLLYPPRGAHDDAWTIVGSLVMLSSWGLLVWAHRRRRAAIEQLGLTTEKWAGSALLGGVAGAAVGVHLMLTGHFAGLEHGPRPDWATVVWQVSYWAGLRGLGEELLFRGLGFRLLRERLSRSFWATAAPLMALNVLPYLVTRSSVVDEPAGLWVLPYVALMALLNVALREWWRSLIPCLACNVAFNLVLLVGLGYVV